LLVALPGLLARTHGNLVALAAQVTLVTRVAAIHTIHITAALVARVGCLSIGRVRLIGLATATIHAICTICTIYALVTVTRASERLALSRPLPGASIRIVGRVGRRINRVGLSIPSGLRLLAALM
jgi:hypothetical protein